MTCPLADRRYTLTELAEMGLPGLPGSRQKLAAMADREGWEPLAEARAGSGGGVVYSPRVLPREAQAALLARDTVTDAVTAVMRVREWVRLGRSKADAVRYATKAGGFSEASVWRWCSLGEGLEGDALRDALLPVEAVRGQMEGAAQAEDDHATREAGLAAFVALPDAVQAMAEARAAVLRAVEALAAQGMTLNEARVRFVALWSEGGDALGLGADVREAVGSVSAPTLKRWASLLRRQGLVGLAPKWGSARKGKGRIEADEAMRGVVEGMLVTHPGCTTKQIIRALGVRIEGPLPSARTIQRWVGEWRENNRALDQMMASPDGYRSKMRLVSGRADEGIVRLNQRWELDSTPNDVILADGKRHNLVGVIDVYSRRAILLVSRTSTSAAVAACLRKAILAWGVPEEIKTDNGADYASRHIEQVCAGLDIHQDFCPPFQPDKKPHIERFFGTFTRDMMPMIPGFVGHNVSQRKTIEEREAFSKRMMDRGAEPVVSRLTAEELQQRCDTICEGLYGRETQGGIGVSPFAKAQAWTGPVRDIRDERALDVLLMPLGTRTVTKRGVSYENGHYTDPNLVRHMGKKVMVRTDEADWGRVLVQEMDGTFIAWAICPERSGVSRAEYAAYMNAKGREIDSELRRRASELKREQRLETVAADILDKAEREMGDVIAFPGGRREIHTSDALEAASKAVETRGKPKLVERAQDVTAEDVAALAPVAKLERPKKAEEPVDKFVRWRGVDARVRGGEDVSEAEARFWRAFPQRPEYAEIVMLIEEHGEESILGNAAAQTRA